jgi:hypothetical protein
VAMSTWEVQELQDVLEALGFDDWLCKVFLVLKK